MDKEKKIEATIIIPSHNEASIISRLLNAVIEYSQKRAAEIIVIPNGCTDNTMEVLEKYESSIQIIELNEGSKNKAINAAIERAQGRVLVVLDADTELLCEDLDHLINAVKGPIHYATIHGNYVLDGCDWVVRGYYKAYDFLGFQSEGGNGIYANTKSGIRERIGSFPSDVNDDTLSCWAFLPEERAYIKESAVKIHVPKTHDGLINGLSRSTRRRLHLEKVIPPEVYKSRRDYKRFSSIKRVIKKPDIWLSYLIYLLIKFTTKRAGYKMFNNNDTRWLSDREDHCC